MSAGLQSLAGSQQSSSLNASSSSAEPPPVPSSRQYAAADASLKEKRSVSPSPALPPPISRNLAVTERATGSHTEPPRAQPVPPVPLGLEPAGFPEPVPPVPLGRKATGFPEPVPPIPEQHYKLAAAVPPVYTLQRVKRKYEKTKLKGRPQYPRSYELCGVLNLKRCLLG